ncbi:MAG: patatin-like phospholipase family protein, partial [Deltaproteobacteria bacterium]|nr:patatin-like phospholipase family protein [Deltaproteobacteria bacterium]
MTPKNAENTQRTALVVSGGGSKGAFAVGAIEVLRERGTDFDLICGTSTGSLIA